MNIKVDKNGLLLLQRGSEMKEQLCPFSSDTNQCCGDWCPLFYTVEKGVKLFCGHGVAVVAISNIGETFTDERSK